MCYDVWPFLYSLMGGCMGFCPISSYTYNIPPIVPTNNTSPIDNWANSTTDTGSLSDKQKGTMNIHNKEDHTSTNNRKGGWMDTKQHTRETNANVRDVMIYERGREGNTSYTEKANEWKETGKARHQVLKIVCIIIFLLMYVLFLCMTCICALCCFCFILSQTNRFDIEKMNLVAMNIGEMLRTDITTQITKRGTRRE